MRRLIVLGSGGFAFTMLDALLDTNQKDFELAGFAQNEDPTPRRDSIEGFPVYTLAELAPLAATHEAICLLGDCAAKRRFVEQVQALGFRFATLINPNTRFSRFSEMGAGGYVAYGSVVGSHTRIGRHCSIMSLCMVGDNCQIGDYGFIASGTHIGGGVTIGLETYIGMSAVIRDHIAIGAHAVVGAGAVVVRDVPDGTTVVGNPARPITR